MRDDVTENSTNKNSTTDLNTFEAMGVRAAQQLMNATVPERGLSRAGMQYDGKRMVDKVLGYPDNPDVQEYRDYYDERGIPSVIVDRPPQDTWKKNPKVTDESGGDSDFMSDWDNIMSNHSIFHHLKRLDVLSGIGRFGVLLLGFDDENNDDLSQKVKNPTDLLFIRPFSEEYVDVNDVEDDLSNERFGYPTEYSIDLTSVDIPGFNPSNPNRDVHHSRVIHVAEGLLDNEIYGEPRLQKVFNRIIDLDKLIGAAPEGFWQQAARGFHIQEKEKADLEDEQFDEIAEEFEKFIHGFKRVWTSSGVDVDELTGQVNVDPSNPFDVIISVISAKTGIPKRLLTGSERGDLASSQDRKNWFDRVEERQTNHAGPQILDPFIDRLVQFDILAGPKDGSWEIQWPTLWTPTAKEKAEIMEKKANALQKASGGMPQNLMDWDVIVDFVFDMDPEEAKKNFDDQETVDESDQQVQQQFKVAKQLEDTVSDGD